MDNRINKILTDKPVVVPKYFFELYKKLNITEEELIIIIYIFNKGTKIVYNPEIFMDIGFDKYKIMEIINNLVEKKIIEITVEKNTLNQREEYISLDLFFTKIYNLIIEKEEKLDINNSDIFSIFENEFGRTLSPMEYEIIKGWTNDNISYELITAALKEATYNGVSNLRYIDKILYEWKKKGFNTLNDITIEKQKYRDSKNKKVDVFDYNWLDDE